MNIEQEHLNIIQINNEFFMGTNEAELNSSKDSAELTTKIAIDFADWIAEKWTPNDKLSNWDSNELNSDNEPKPLTDVTKGLFNIFIKDYEN